MGDLFGWEEEFSSDREFRGWSDLAVDAVEGTDLTGHHIDAQREAESS